MTQSCQGCVTIDDITEGMVVANGDIVSAGCCSFLWVLRFHPSVAHQTPVKWNWMLVILSVLSTAETHLLTHALKGKNTRYPCTTYGLPCKNPDIVL
jgi:hypothetical protein